MSLFVTPHIGDPMKIMNKTKNTCLGSVEIADTFISRFVGLMFKKNIEKGLLLKLPEKRGRRGSAIHMFFMRVPLDVIFVDDKKKVVDIVALKPWQMYMPRTAASYVIELQEGKIKDSNTEIGDILEFIQ